MIIIFSWGNLITFYPLSSKILAKVTTFGLSHTFRCTGITYGAVYANIKCDCQTYEWEPALTVALCVVTPRVSLCVPLPVELPSRSLHVWEQLQGGWAGGRVCPSREPGRVPWRQAANLQSALWSHSGRKCALETILTRVLTSMNQYGYFEHQAF